MTSHHRPTVLITGANRGLGRAAARAAHARGARVVCAGRKEAELRAVADSIDGDVLTLDLAELGSLDEAVAALGEVEVVVCNAGAQTVHPLVTTSSGFEHTFQVNHLSHLRLVDLLLARPCAPQRVIFIGSGTHDPDVRTGTPDPMPGSIEAMARAQADPTEADRPSNDRDTGLQRYATSKMLAIAAAAALAREHPEMRVNAFDPGLMPGTGLARDFPLGFRLLWHTALRPVSLMPFASTPRTSGEALARLALEEPAPVPSGAYTDQRLRAKSASVRASDTSFQDEVLRESRVLIDRALSQG